MEGQIYISAEIIWHKAEHFWVIIYPGMEKPTFSNGWLHWFQSQRSIRWHKQYGEAGDVPKQAECHAAQIVVNELIFKLLCSYRRENQA